LALFLKQKDLLEELYSVKCPNRQKTEDKRKHLATDNISTDYHQLIMAMKFDYCETGPVILAKGL
jgi:hypothetical protein